uniref:thiamine phosphate synthase n=1 Tax=Hirondellea gigas TaxID=1518452 RepID=A0A6A7G4H4_9CRUS
MSLWHKLTAERLEEISKKRNQTRQRILSQSDSKDSENFDPQKVALKKVCPLCQKPNALQVTQCRPCSFPLSEWDITGVSSNPFLRIISGEDSLTEVVYRDSEVIIFNDQFGVSAHHLQSVSTASYSGVTVLTEEHIPLLERFYELGIKELESRNLAEYQSRSIRDHVVAGYNIPGSVEHLHLHLVLPPFHHENVFEYPRWHSHAKVIHDLKTSGRVIPYAEVPNVDEGRIVYENAIRDHRELIKSSFSELKTPIASKKAFNLALYAITNSEMAERNGFTLTEAVKASIQGGATMIQIREKNCDSEEFLKRARSVLEVCRELNVPLLINDSVDIMFKIGADGVHIGQSDGNPQSVRKEIGPSKILGVSASTVDEARRAIADGADYLGTGAVFSTGTKPDKSVIGMDGLSRITKASSIPVVAIGGIKTENVHELKDTGISGIAIVSGVFSNADVYSSSVCLRRAFEIMSQPTYFPSLYAITSNPTPNDSLSDFSDFLSKTERMIRRFGIELLQFRAKTLKRCEYVSVAKRIQSICSRYACRLLINGELDLLREIPNVSGIHLTSSQLRELSSPENRSKCCSLVRNSSISCWDDIPLVGASCHNMEELRLAESLSCHFAVLSPVLPTTSHPNAAPLGWTEFRNLTKAVSIPVFGLGGLSPNDLDLASQHGAHGIAAISSLWPS